MKAHIREEKKTAPLKLGEGTLFQNKDSKLYNICVMAIWDSTNECFFEKETRLRIRNEDIYMWWKNEQTLV